MLPQAQGIKKKNPRPRTPAQQQAFKNFNALGHVKGFPGYLNALMQHVMNAEGVSTESISALNSLNIDYKALLFIIEKEIREPR